jgi:hypothetical protein
MKADPAIRLEKQRLFGEMGAARGEQAPRRSQDRRRLAPQAELQHVLGETDPNGKKKA